MSEVEKKADVEEQPTLSNIYVLKHPVQFGDELIEQIELKPNGRAMKGFRIVATGNGGHVVDPYELAELGLRLGCLARAVVDHMHPVDISGLGMLAMLFINGGLATGKTPSP